MHTVTYAHKAPGVYHYVSPEDSLLYRSAGRFPPLQIMINTWLGFLLTFHNLPNHNLFRGEEIIPYLNTSSFYHLKIPRPPDMTH